MQTVHVIDSANRFKFSRFKEMWQYRELFYFLAMREIKVRYKQTFFGVMWALFQPLTSMMIFTFVFSQVVGQSLDAVNYSVFVLSGWLPWMFFINGITGSSNSLVADANLLKKVYFPRLIMPLSSICACFVEFFITLSLLLLLMAFNGYYPGMQLVFLPLAIFALFVVTAAFGILLATVNALFRDVRHAVPFLMQMWFFFTCVIYPAEMIPEKWQVIYLFNPMNGIVELFRWVFLGSYLEFPMLAFAVSISASIGLALFALGIYYFSRMEKVFADVV